MDASVAQLKNAVRSEIRSEARGVEENIEATQRVATSLPGTHFQT